MLPYLFVSIVLLLSKLSDTYNVECLAYGLTSDGYNCQSGVTNSILIEVNKMGTINVQPAFLQQLYLIKKKIIIQSLQIDYIIIE